MTFLYIIIYQKILFGNGYFFQVVLDTRYSTLPKTRERKRITLPHPAFPRQVWGLDALFVHSERGGGGGE